jgi:hypothetical protein
MKLQRFFSRALGEHSATAMSCALNLEGYLDEPGRKGRKAEVGLSSEFFNI